MPFSSAPTTAFVQLDAITKRYREGAGGRTVFSGLSAHIAKGEIIALFGRSGSGKSTLLNLLAGIDPPDAGRVVIDGTDLAAANERARTVFRRRNIGFVFQSFNLIPTLTAMENLLLRVELDGRADAASRARATALLDEVGLAARADSFPDRLSGGEQQRVAVAAALVHQPALILADEPTGNLDEHTAATMLALLARLVRRAGATMLVATHSSEVAAIADRVWTLHDGVIQERAGEV